jgi:carbonic anhydrase
VGVSRETARRVWKAHGLRPWRRETFKISNDPLFAEKLVDIVGLYLDPPERAVVVCFDEKTQVQALDRTQPSLPIKRGRAQTMTHDYKRNGTSDLFAALEVHTPAGWCTITALTVLEERPQNDPASLKTVLRIRSHAGVECLVVNGPSAELFSDVLAANEAYAAGFSSGGLRARAARGLAVVTCIDSRIEPLAMLGLRPGDAKILRNAGARVTDDVLRTLVLASYLLGVDRAMIIAHTDCRMTTASEDDIHAAVAEAGAPDTRSLSFLVTSDQRAALRSDVQRVQSWPYLARLQVGGFLYDIDTGRLSQLC